MGYGNDNIDPLLLDLPSRLITALHKNGLTRIEDVVSLSRSELLDQQGIGPVTLEHFIDLLDELDVELGTSLPEAPFYYGDQEDMLHWLSGYRYRKWWKSHSGVDLFQEFTAISGWIMEDALKCTMEHQSQSISVSVNYEDNEINCSCGSRRCEEHGLAGFLLMIKEERKKELFDKTTLKEENDEEAPVYQPLSWDPLFYLLNSTTREKLIHNGIKWMEELARCAPEEVQEIHGIGTKRYRHITRVLKKLNLQPGVPPESIDLEPGKRFPPEFAEKLLELRRIAYNPDRGVSYFQQGNVRQLNKKSEFSYSGKVQGRRMYTISMNFNESRFDCSCPVNDWQGPCKHIFAAALTAAKRERIRVFSRAGYQELSDDLYWLMEHVNSESSDAHPSGKSPGNPTNDPVHYYFYQTGREWNLYPSFSPPEEIHGELPISAAAKAPPIAPSDVQTPKDKTLIRHLNNHYFDVRPSRRKGLLGEILPMMSDRPVFVRNESDSFMEVEITEEEVTPALQLTSEAQGSLKLLPYLVHEEDHSRIDHFTLFSRGPTWVLVQNKLYRLETIPFFNELIDRMQTGTISISEQEQSVFIEEIFPDLVDQNVPLELDAELLEQKSLEPEPRVYLKEESDRLLVELRFAYGEVEFKQIGEGRYPVPHPEGTGLIEIQRDADQEKTSLQLLQNSGLVDVPEKESLTLTPEEDRTEWLLEELPELPENGFTVFGEDQLENRPTAVNPVQSSAVIESGIDWFELEGEIQFEAGSVPFEQILNQSTDERKYIQLSDTEYGKIPETWLRRFARIDDLASTDNGTVQMPGLSLEELNELLETVDETRTGETFEQYQRFYREFDGIDPVRESDGFQGTLRDYQRAGLAWLQFLRQYGFGGLLADDMGLGKTVQVLAHLQLVREETGEIPDTLIVAPRSVLSNWEREANRFLPNPNIYRHHGQKRREPDDVWPEHHLTITTYGTMRSDIDWLNEIEFDTVVLDECQAIRNPETKRAKASRLLTAENRIGLSGTPVQNTVMDLWSQFQFLNPGLLGDRSYFEDRFARPIEQDRNREISDRLQNLIHPFLLRRTKDQVERQLPELSKAVVDCPLRPDQETVYESCRRHYRKEVSASIEESGVHQSRFKVLEGLTRLRQICCHPSLVSEQENGHQRSAKLDRFVELAREVIDEGHRALVFSQFVQFLDVLKETTEEEGWNYEYLDGSTRNREKRVNHFQNNEDIPLFFISLKAGGEGLNLTGADYVFLMDPWWNPAVERQAMDRTHRIGQDKPVFVYRLICPDTIEEKMIELQQKKQEVAENIVTPEAGVFKDMEQEELIDLFH